ncbi:MAG: hypothetical protein HON81_05790 [Verrucomicrobia bacterium]|nr:hypothetical protein [Verrucomicrobiota bacterium]
MIPLRPFCLISSIACLITTLVVPWQTIGSAILVADFSYFTERVGSITS